jgi:nucleoside-diphosphate-sugar epimerase
MRILIVGGTGNISAAITSLLVKRGDEIVLCNRGNANKELGGQVRVILCDRNQHAAFEARMKTAGEFDCVIDMIGYHAEDARSAVRAFAGRTKQFIFCSTVDVYTKLAKNYPIKEDAERNASPSFPYAYEKVLCENIFMDAASKGAFALTILRPAATYQDSWCPLSFVGSGQALLKRIRTGKPLIVLGDGLSLWASSHRDDVAVAFANAAGNVNAHGKSYNVNGDECLTFIRYYQTIAKVMGAPPPAFVKIPADVLGLVGPNTFSWCVENFQYNNVLDNTAAKTDLGYRYTITWAEGVRRMVAFQDAHGGIDSATDDPRYDRLIECWHEHVETLVRSLSGFDG